MMELVMQWIQMACDREEMEPEELGNEVTVMLPWFPCDVAIVQFLDREVFISAPMASHAYAYWTNVYDNPQAMENDAFPYEMYTDSLR